MTEITIALWPKFGTPKRQELIMNFNIDGLRIDHTHTTCGFLMARGDPLFHNTYDVQLANVGQTSANFSDVINMTISVDCSGPKPRFLRYLARNPRQITKSLIFIYPSDSRRDIL